jgi:hypothetical protein|tara:strand:+ start:5826 stop:5981 length:156 start_codon:yes stop_codon:yes gene_type:complete
MDFQTILAIAIIAGVVFFVMKNRKGKSTGGSGRAKSGAGGSISKYKNAKRK